MLVSLIEVPSCFQAFIGSIYNRFEQQVIISHVSLYFYTISLYKIRKCTPRWHILGVVLQTDAVCLWRVGSILFITVFVVPDFTTTISINRCGWISNFIGFTVCFTAFICLLFWFKDILPWFAHRTPPRRLEPAADPLDAEGHQAEATLRTRGGSDPRDGSLNRGCDAYRKA